MSVPTIRAYSLSAFGARPGLTHLPVPDVGARQVRVRVRASSVNPVDVATSSGAFRDMYEYRFPSVQGRDFAGTVEAVGADVSAFAPGDEVFGMVKRSYVGDGTFAQLVVVDEDRHLVSRPAALSVAEAGVLGLAGTTALLCVDALGLKVGETVFINGATGGVGAFAVQIAAMQGLDVVATARPGEEARHVRDLGAAEAVDWSTGDVADAVRRLRPSGVSGVIDLVSRNSAAFLAIAALAGKAAVSTLGAAPDGFVHGPALINIHSQSDPVLLRRIAALVVAGAVRVPIANVFSFAEIDDALASLTTAPLGKVGLDFER